MSDQNAQNSEIIKKILEDFNAQMDKLQMDFNKAVDQLQKDTMIKIETAQKSAENPDQLLDDALKTA
jgi:t-SNARE complex subunit (syntaxin)